MNLFMNLVLWGKMTYVIFLLHSITELEAHGNLIAQLPHTDGIIPCPVRFYSGHD